LVNGSATAHLFPPTFGEGYRAGLIVCDFWWSYWNSL